MTNLNRRRFLAISAAAASMPAMAFAAQPVTWSGFAFGAEVSIKLYGPAKDSQAAIDEAVARMVEIEKEFSIYDSRSALSNLNEAGELANPSQDFADLLDHCDVVNRLTDGLFDPLVQSIFDAKAQEIPYTVLTAAQSTGWHRVTHDRKIVRFTDPGMSITLNGIAQGYATDAVKQVLDRHGFTESLINIGEFKAGDRLSKLGIADPDGNIFETVEIKNRAIATSSAGGYRFKDGSSHILHPEGRAFTPHWTTVSVMADDATYADGFSTALCLTEDTTLARQLKLGGHVHEVILQNREGRVVRV